MYIYCMLYVCMYQNYYVSVQAYEHMYIYVYIINKRNQIPNHRNVKIDMKIELLLLVVGNSFTCLCCKRMYVLPYRCPTHPILHTPHRTSHTPHSILHTAHSTPHPFC